MNNETRKALIEVIEAELDSYCPSPFNGAFAVSLMQIIDRLLTTRPEPAADAMTSSSADVERAALVADLTVILQRVKYVKLGESLSPIAEEIIELVTAARDAEIREAFATILEKYAKDTVWVNDHTTALDALDAAIGRAEGGAEK